MKRRGEERRRGKKKRRGEEEEKRRGEKRKQERAGSVGRAGDALIMRLSLLGEAKLSLTRRRALEVARADA